MLVVQLDMLTNIYFNYICSFSMPLTHRFMAQVQCQNYGTTIIGSRGTIWVFFSLLNLGQLLNIFLIFLWM